MFPNIHYQNGKWPLTQHMKLIVEGSLHSLLYAACTYASYASPAERINEYLVANEIVPPNIRSDSQLSDIWRDYQQVLAELGFMYSTRVTGGIIEPTPCGLHLLDNESQYREILTNQVLLYQYPNGSKREYVEEQINNGVLIRPAVLIWRVLSIIVQRGGTSILSSKEIRDYLMRCCVHNDAEACAEAILSYRQGRPGLPVHPDANAGRNATDWITLLGNTLLFDEVRGSGSNKAVKLSKYALDNFEELDTMMSALEDQRGFWRPTYIDKTVRRDWYSFYGALRLDVTLPEEDPESSAVDMEVNRDEKEIGFGSIGEVNLTDFDAARLNYKHENRTMKDGTIESSYDANMTTNRHRLHDAMVILIASTCADKGARVFDDAKSIDLLVMYENTEYIIEVKTVTPRNYVNRLRYAVGQLLHYDFMLRQELPERRKVVAMPSLLPQAPGFLNFFNNHLDFDVLSLRSTIAGQVISCNSNNSLSHKLFS